jgi:hypothetical protein
MVDKVDAMQSFQQAGGVPDISSHEPDFIETVCQTLGTPAVQIIQYGNGASALLDQPPH